MDPFSKIGELETEVKYLKKMLNLKRAKGGINDVLLKLKELEIENKKLKKLKNLNTSFKSKE